MRSLTPFFAAVLLLGGCSYAWVRPDATPQQVGADEQACRAEAANIVSRMMFDPTVWPGAWGPVAGPWGPVAGPWGPVVAGRWGPGWYTGWWPDPATQVQAQQRVFDSCMRARGYNLVRVDRQSGEPR